jgi:hypothetical protein
MCVVNVARDMQVTFDGYDTTVDQPDRATRLMSYGNLSGLRLRRADQVGEKTPDYQAVLGVAFLRNN